MGFNGVENLGERGWLGDFTAKDEKKMGTHGISPWFSPSFKMFNHQTCLKITGYESYMSRRLMISSGIHCGLLQVDKSRTGVLVGFTKANFVQICYIDVYCIIQVKWVHVYLYIYIYIYIQCIDAHILYIPSTSYIELIRLPVKVPAIWRYESQHFS